MMKTMMMCGHASNGIDANTKKPVCVICNEDRESPIPAEMQGRIAKCMYGCGGVKKSSLSLPFFEFRPAHEFDRFYDGCSGWD